jgi:tetratricopeptide (TPR) repeat protein
MLLNRSYTAAILTAFIAASFVLCAGLSGSITRERIEKGYVSRLPQATPVDVPLNQFFGAALMTGFRGIVADLLWLECDHFWHGGEWHKLLPYYYFITRLQPKFVTVWVVGGWHMAYNVSYRVAHDKTLPEAERELESARWVERGIAFLKEGLRHNADRYEIYFELGWDYYHKVKDYREAVVYLEQAVRRPHPQWVERVLAHAYEKCGRYRDAYDVWRGIDEDTGGKDGPAKRKLEELGVEMTMGK